MAPTDRTDSAPIPTDDPAFAERREIHALLARGNREDLALAAQVVDSFPHGCDGFAERWITLAISTGCRAGLRWMIDAGVALRSDKVHETPVLITCLQSATPDKYPILELLIRSGADLDARGSNGWTPLHMAAVQDDERAMQMLLEAGADRTATTLIDDDLTPEQEARHLGHAGAADFIARFAP